jgi:hypothetical protein
MTKQVSPQFVADDLERIAIQHTQGMAKMFKADPQGFVKFIMSEASPYLLLRLRRVRPSNKTAVEPVKVEGRIGFVICGDSKRHQEKLLNYNKGA